MIAAICGTVPTEDEIKRSLLEQLESQNKNTAYCVSLVEDYMIHWRLKERMKVDLEKRGLWVTVVGGNGFETEKRNPSIRDLKDETSIMLQILDKLALREPILKGNADDYL